MIGIYHSRDLDGYASGAIMKKRFPTIKLIGYDYGQPFDLDQIDGQTIMADVSMPMEIMVEIAKRSGWNFIWIDHHISAIKDYEAATLNTESFCTAVLDTKISACEATWKHFFPNEEMPEGIKLLGEYDTWRNGDVNHWEGRVLPYQFGMRIRCESPESFPWDYIVGFNDVAGTEFIILEGKIVLRYQGQQNESACKRSSFEVDFAGHTAICLNGGGFNSDVFKSVYDPSRHELMMPFQFNGKFWTISLYTTHDHIDCSVIAKSRGGGGHKKAAGFQTNDIKEVFPNI